MERRHSMLARGLAVWLAATAAGAACAQPAANYPTKPVRLLVPNLGASEVIARVLGAELFEMWGVPIVVDTRPGASGAIALDTVAKAAADGYTIFLGTVNTNGIAETTFAGVLKMSPSRDLAGVTNLVEIHAALIAHPAFAATTVRQLIDYAKANPGKLSYASAGIGTYPQLDMLRLMKAAGFTGTHVPYRTGGGGMVIALIGGEVNVGFVNLAASLPNVRAGRMRALAVNMRTRHTELSNVPTMTEEGFPGIGTEAWNGLFVPVGVPAPIVDRIFRSSIEVMSRPHVKERFAKLMMAVVLSASPREYSEFARAETRKWAEVIRENNVRIE